MRIVICDNEKEARDKYTSLFERFCTNNDVAAEIKSYKSGDQLLFDADEIIKNVDILFQDINMPGTNGMDTAKRLRELGYQGELIFLTVSKDNVFFAFDVRAMNYIVKDVTSEHRIESIFMQAVTSAKEKKSEYLLLTGVGEYRNVPIASIEYFEVMQRIITVYYEDEVFEFVSTMGKLENNLFNRGFVRISRSYLVATRYISSFSYEKVTLSSGIVLPVGRKYYKALKEEMKKSSPDDKE